MSKSYWKKIIESKIDDGGIVPKDYSDGWTNLDIGNIPCDFFVNENYEVEFEDREWRKFLKPTEDRADIVANVIRFNVKYRYKLKPLAPITLSRTDLKIIDNWIDMDKSFMNYESENGILTKFNGREVVIL